MMFVFSFVSLLYASNIFCFYEVLKEAEFDVKGLEKDCYLRHMIYKILYLFTLLAKTFLISVINYLVDSIYN